MISLASVVYTPEIICEPTHGWAHKTYVLILYVRTLWQLVQPGAGCGVVMIGAARLFQCSAC